MKRKEYFKITTIAALLFFSGSINNQVKAVTDLGDYIHVKADVSAGEKELWEFQGVGSTYGDFNVSATTSGTYECALFLTEENDFITIDSEQIVWVNNEAILGKNSSLFLDVNSAGWFNCCNGSSLNCEIDNPGRCHWNDCDFCGDSIGAKGVFEQNYGSGWTDKCSGADCNLSTSDTNYVFENQILCETTWKRCGATEITCKTYNTRTYACNNRTWTLCTGTATPDCDSVTGTCIAAALPVLTLTAVAIPDQISVGANSAVTFTVEEGGNPTSGATVSGISVISGGGIVSGGGSCGPTNASGECTVTYTAPGAPTTAIVKATKATKVGYTDSGSASAAITVNSCPATALISIDPPNGTVGDTLTVDGTNSTNDFSLCLYDQAENLEDEQSGNAGNFESITFTADAAGTWTGTIELGLASCPASPGGCKDASIISVAGGGGGAVSCPGQLNCGTVVAAGCACGTAIATVSDIGKACCAMNNAFYPDFATCDATSLCAGAGGGGGGGGGAAAAACDPNTWFFCNPLRGTVETIAQAGEVMLGYILGLIGSVALLFIIIAGVMYMTSAGNEEKISSSKRILNGAVIGLMIALLAYGLLHVIMTVLGM